jgi:hypothetical protein
LLLGLPHAVLFKFSNISLLSGILALGVKFSKFKKLFKLISSGICPTVLKVYSKVSEKLCPD